jgi:hypothetical protein
VQEPLGFRVLRLFEDFYRIILGNKLITSSKTIQVLLRLSFFSVGSYPVLSDKLCYMAHNGKLSKGTSDVAKLSVKPMTDNSDYELH